MSFPSGKIKRHFESLPPWIVTAIVLAAILWLTLAPHPVGDVEVPLFPGADKLAHALMFGGLAFVACLDWCRVRSWRSLSGWLITLFAVASALIGIGIEYLQSAMHLGRAFEVADMVADASGALLTGLGWYIYERVRKSRSKKRVEKTEAPAEASDSTESGEPVAPEPKKKHKALKITLRVFLAILIFILLIPVLIYIPPVQTLLKDVACSVVKDKTGMDIGIEKFRLKFPLDVSLQGVSVVEATGDTMVSAREVIADVKLMPLLHLDVDVNRIRLLQGYYRMVSTDSSMIMKIRAGLLDVDSKSAVSIKDGPQIFLNKVLLKDGDVSLYMNVWKKKPVPPDSVTPTMPLVIRATDLKVQNIRFAMSMLPVIDTLAVATRDLDLKNAVIDLGSSKIDADNLRLAHGSFVYTAPTPEYVRTHPAPVDTITPPSPPFKIKVRRIAIADFRGVYGIKGARPASGFDPNRLELSNIDIALHDFYNEASTVVLPVESIRADERSGLRITEGSGTFRLDSVGISLADLKVRTPFSRIDVSADIPFALMELNPDAPLDVKADASIGLPDAEAFLPSLSAYTKYFPKHSPLEARVVASGRLSDVDISSLDARMAGIFRLRARGYARNVLDFKRLDAFVDIDGEVSNPSPIDKIAGPLGFELPPFRLSGTASALRNSYTADLRLKSPAGDVSAKGHVSLGAESYNADVETRNVDIARFLPTLGIGSLTASVSASGAGFNPAKPGAATNIKADVANIVYNGKPLRDITADVTLKDGLYAIDAASRNPSANFDISLTGQVAPDLYSARGRVQLFDVDLQALGLTKDICSGSGDILIDATASPERWLYDADLRIENFDWNLPDTYIHLPNGLKADLVADETSVKLLMDAQQTSVSFESSAGLERVVGAFMKASDIAMAAIDRRRVAVDTLQRMLPPFTLDVNASGRGLLSQFLTPSGLSLDTVYAHLANDSVISGRIGALALNTGSVKLDTLALDLHQRGSLIDYKGHLGNRPGTFDEFAQVDLSGYFGYNRLSAFLRQRNIQGQMGYRIGLTAALDADDNVSLHFTPLKATIAYLPWKFNTDNHIDYNLRSRMVDANLQASSKESSILVRTEENAGAGGSDLHLNLTNIHVQDFLQMFVSAPPLTASVNSDIRLHYDGSKLEGSGTLGVSDFIYDKSYVGDFNLNLDAGVDFKGDTNVSLGLDVDGRRDAMKLVAVLGPDEASGALDVKDVRLALSRFPLRVANPFLGASVARLGGYLNGDMSMTGSIARPVLNGSISCDSVNVFVPFFGSSLRFDTVPVTVKDNILAFDRFDVWGANQNPLTLDGTVNASELADIRFDLSAKASDFLLMKNDKRARSDLYGRLAINLDATCRGSMRALDINADAGVLGSTDVYYNLPASTAMTVDEGDNGVVTFVNLNDTTLTASKDTVPNMMYMRLNARLNVAQGTQVTVNLSQNGTDKVVVNPSGQLTFSQNYMGDMHLNGQLNTGEGMARYNVPVMGEKSFDILQGSYVLWNGALLNPVLNLKLSDRIKASVSQNGGNTRLVNFIVGVSATGTLSQPNVAFDLSTDDDMSLQNELQSMTAEQRQQQAMNLLITGQYTGLGMKSNAGPITGNVYSFLASQLNSWAAKTIRGVDLSFGVNQYDNKTDGRSSVTTSYSYQLSKSLFNNRFKINVGGNYSTDASADENLTQNLISDISFEYTIKQTGNMSILAKLFRHIDYESILEGDVTETGVGLVFKRRVNNLFHFFRFRKRKKKQPADSVPAAVEKGAATRPATVKKGGKK